MGVRRYTIDAFHTSYFVNPTSFFMSLLELPFSYLLWHYVYAWADLVRLYRNFSWFLWNFFSIPLLSKTLFSPWKRLQEAAQKDTAGVLGSFILNTLLRFVGFFARILTLCLGFVSLALFLFAGVVFLIIWPLLPLLAIFSTVMGIVTLASF